MSSTVRPWRLWMRSHLLPKSAAVVGPIVGIALHCVFDGGAEIVGYLNQVPCRRGLGGDPQELGHDLSSLRRSKAA